MDNEVKWIAILFLGFFGILMGSLVASDYLTHAQRMECIKLHGDWSDKACRFPK